MIWLLDGLPVFTIAFTATMLVRWSLPSLAVFGLGFGVLHWIAIGTLFGYEHRGGHAVIAFVPIVGVHALAWCAGVVAAARLRPRSP